MRSRRGLALVAIMLMLLLLAAVLGGLPWLLRSESLAAREDMAAVRARLAAEAAVTVAARVLEALPPESLGPALGRMPPPVHLAGGAIGYAEFEPVDSAMVEVVAQGFAGQAGIALARRQLCALLELRQVPDSNGVRVELRSRLPGAMVDC